MIGFLCRFPPGHKECGIINLTTGNSLAIVVERVRNRVAPGNVRLHPSSCDPDEGRKFPASTHSQRKSVIQGTVLLGVNLIHHSHCGRQALFAIRLGRHHTVHRAKPGKLDSVTVQFRDARQLTRCLNHSASIAENDTGLFLLGGNRINLCAFRPKDQTVERHDRADSRLAILTRHAHKLRLVTIPTILICEQMFKQQNLPRTQLQHLTRLARHRVLSNNPKRFSKIGNRLLTPTSLNSFLRYRGEPAWRPARDFHPQASQTA